MKLIVTYGSQTGAAHSIAQQLYDTSVAKSVPCHLAALNELKSTFSDGVAGLRAIFPSNAEGTVSPVVLVVVVSTTGDGEVPDRDVRGLGGLYHTVARTNTPLKRARRPHVSCSPSVNESHWARLPRSATPAFSHTWPLAGLWWGPSVPLPPAEEVGLGPLERTALCRFGLGGHKLSR